MGVAVVFGNGVESNLQALEGVFVIVLKEFIVLERSFELCEIVP